MYSGKTVPYTEFNAKKSILLQERSRVFALHMYSFARRLTPHEQPIIELKAGSERLSKCTLKPSDLLYEKIVINYADCLQSL